jgi:hypothetical protein
MKQKQIAKTMEKADQNGFGKPDEVREFPKGRVELIKVGSATIGRAVFEPGWRWSTSVQPIANTKSCEAPHFQCHVSGRLMIRMDDGTEFECRPGDVSLLPSGHDAWVWETSRQWWWVFRECSTMPNRPSRRGVNRPETNRNRGKCDAAKL